MSHRVGALKKQNHIPQKELKMETGAETDVSSKLTDAVKTFLGLRDLQEHFPSTTGRNMLVIREPETVRVREDVRRGTSPIPQTQITRLQEELLTKRGKMGVFCVLPEEGRIEFVQRGGSDVFFEFATTFADKFFGKIPQRLTYDSVAASFAAAIIDEKVSREIGKQWPYCFITHFPERSEPFWNVKKLGGESPRSFFSQVDLLVHGKNVMRTAEFSCDREEMRQAFERMHGGKFAAAIREKFGDRFDTRLDLFFRMKFEPHSGGTIDLSELAQATEASS